VSARSDLQNDPWPALHLALFRDVPAKPTVKSQKSIELTSNPLDNIFGLIALHTCEFRHWAYQQVWWSEHPGQMPASGGIPPEFNIAGPFQHWEAEMIHKNLPNDGSRPVAAPHFEVAENTLAVPAIEGDTHFRSMHLVLGLAELFVHYAFDASAKDIYEAYLERDIVIQKRTRQQRPPCTTSLAGQ